MCIHGARLARCPGLAAGRMRMKLFDAAFQQGAWRQHCSRQAALLLHERQAARRTALMHSRQHPMRVATHPRLCRFWEWKGHKIRYQRSGDSGPAVLLVHGFGGNW